MIWKNAAGHIPDAALVSFNFFAVHVKTPKNVFIRKKRFFFEEKRFYSKKNAFIRQKVTLYCLLAYDRQRAKTGNQ